MPTDCVPIRVRALLVGGLTGVLLSGVGCKELTGSPGLPAGTPNPSFYANAAGAIGMRNAAVFEFEQVLPTYVIDAGLLTDELQDPLTGASAGVLLSTHGVTDGLDERILPVGVEGQNAAGSYTDLQKVRGYTQQALGALAAYDTAPKDLATAKVLRGELYAFEGYAELLLADLFCSGVPLSTLDFGGDFTYVAGSTTAQVYQDARAKFDTALTLGQASDSLVRLALVGKGRAYLALDNYVAAADDVTTVPDDFRYQVAALWLAPTTNSGNLLNTNANLSDREGANGLPYRSGDPRTASLAIPTLQPKTQDSLFFPVKYNASLTSSVGYAPFTLASGIEARLIQAESQLASTPSGGQWLATLNALRANPANIVQSTNNNYPADTALTSLTDPGTTAGRVALLFRERAFWLYVDGHRQGDLRRLLRQYGQQQKLLAFQSPAQVYPTGAYLAPGIGQYGNDVTAPIPIGPNGETPNALFTGCQGRDP